MAGVLSVSGRLSTSCSIAPDKTALGRILKQKFEKIGCPHTENADETWLAELVFHPGESRLRILHWLFSKFHKKLYDMLDPTYHQWSNADSRLQRLLFVASSLGLCRPNDIDLIQGNTSMSKQMAFIDQLLDLVIIIDSSEDPGKHVLRSPGKVNDSTSIEVQFAQDCKLIDNYCTSGYCSELVESSITLLPLDLGKMIEKTQQLKLAEGSRQTYPDTDKLMQIVAYLTEDIARQSECLRQMEHRIEVTDPQLQQKVTRMLKLTLSELQQMLTTFSYTYENDIEPWCTASAAPQPREFGSRFKHVHNMAESLVSILECLNVIRTTTTHIRQLGAKLQSSPGPQDAKYAESLQESLRVLSNAASLATGTNQP